MGICVETLPFWNVPLRVVFFSESKVLACSSDSFRTAVVKNSLHFLTVLKGNNYIWYIWVRFFFRLLPRVLSGFWDVGDVMEQEHTVPLHSLTAGFVLAKHWIVMISGKLSEEHLRCHQSCCWRTSSLKISAPTLTLPTWTSNHCIRRFVIS